MATNNVLYLVLLQPNLKVISMSMPVSSQDQPFQLFSCRWAWCRLTFSDNAGLVHHVLHDHVRRAIPVRRRDISTIKRAEEGKGESFKMSELMVDMYSCTSRESISHKPGNPSIQHSLSLELTYNITFS